VIRRGRKGHRFWSKKTLYARLGEKEITEIFKALDDHDKHRRDTRDAPRPDFWDIGGIFWFRTTMMDWFRRKDDQGQR
jgi:hypothetical protein